MPQDLKEQYQMDEQKRIAARKARLSKLDLDLDPADTTPAPVKESPAGPVSKPTQAPRQMPQGSVRSPSRQPQQPSIQPPRQMSVQNSQGPQRTPVKEVPFPEPVVRKEMYTDPVQPSKAVSVREVQKHKIPVGKYIGRGAAIFGAVLFLTVYAVFALCFTIAKGPSETARNLAVQSALQASATKWVPGLFLDDKTIVEITEAENAVIQDIVSIEDYNTSDDSANADDDADEWADAIDGMLYETVSGSTYKAYVLQVRDPSRVFVGTSSSDYKNATAGINIFRAAEKYNAIAGINAGEFADAGGVGTGYAPIGLTYSQGECVWNDGAKRTFIGFDRENQLIVRESMTKEEADTLGIRDAVSFQTGNTLIEKDGENMILYYAEGNTGTAQRTAIGQRADGTVILICTDGRTASSLGATHNDMIDMMVSYGAVSAGMLDGGSSSMMYYRDYYDKYETDKSLLDKYQLQGLVNKYKAFTTPRRIPTFFMVDGAS